MKTQKTHSIAGAFDVSLALRSLSAVRAPGSLAPAVLRRVGLADRYWTLRSPLGALRVAAGPAGISLVRKAGSAAAFEREFRRRYGRSVHPASEPAPRPLRDAVANPRTRERRDIRFDLSGLTEFEQAVLRKALEIPQGEVRPYGWIAREIGRPDAVRAAGTALAKNPVPLLIPCHRVVRSDGRIGEYIFGTPAKRALLRTEGVEPRELESLAATGVRFLGNAKRGFFCLPTCGGFESLRRTNRVAFRSAREALAAGFEPCGDCRPALAS